MVDDILRHAGGIDASGRGSSRKKPEVASHLENKGQLQSGNYGEESDHLGRRRFLIPQMQETSDATSADCYDGGGAR